MSGRPDREVLDELFARHRDRLARMVAVRMDRRLRRRFDVEDVVQEVYAEVSRRMAEYRQLDDMPFFLWLRLLAAQKLAELHRRHVLAQGRDIRREATPSSPWGDSAFLADRFTGSVTSPSAAASREELRARMHTALDRLSDNDREVIVLKHFEQLTTAEVAHELGIERAAASKRYIRAVQRLEQVLREFGEPGT